MSVKTGFIPPGRQADRLTGREKDRQEGCQADRQAGSHADRQAGRQATRQAGGQPSTSTPTSLHIYVISLSFSVHWDSPRKMRERRLKNLSSCRFLITQKGEKKKKRKKKREKGAKEKKKRFLRKKKDEKPSGEK